MVSHFIASGCIAVFGMHRSCECAVKTEKGQGSLTGDAQNRRLLPQNGQVTRQISANNLALTSRRMQVAQGCFTLAFSG